METLQLLVPIAWTAIMVFCIMYVGNNKKFPVTFFESVVRVEPSPSLVWSRTRKGSKIAGYVFFGLMWVMFIVVAFDLHLQLMGGEKSKLGLFLIFIPLVLSVIFFFAGYSSKLVNNYMTVDKREFMSWEAGGLIESRGTNYVDVNGTRLADLFEHKKFI